jgi:hypothetical protein
MQPFVYEATAAYPVVEWNMVKNELEDLVWQRGERHGREG